MISKINVFFATRLKLHGAQYKNFAIFSILNYPISFIILHCFGEENDKLGLRFFIIMLSVPFLFVDRFPEKIKNYLPLYWHSVLFISIPFFATFLLLESKFSLEWLMNFSLGLFWFILLVDWVSFIILVVMGLVFGFLAFLLFGSSELSDLIIHDFSVVFLALYMYVYAIILGLTFSRKRMLTEQSRQDTLRSMAGAIAHEMRTPLANVSMSGHVIKRWLEKFKKQMTNSEKEKACLSSTFDSLEHTADNLINTSKRSQNLINLLLTNLSQELDTLPQSVLSMKTVLENTLQDFAYRPHEEEKVHCAMESDFSFKGDQEIVKHILFNLLKNSLYFIHACGKGEIFITLKKGGSSNVILFKDTGPGIKKERLSRLFIPFYSKRPHGTGIGLSFCKRAVESMGGTIRVASKFGEYTEFTITLPCIKENKAL